MDPFLIFLGAAVVLTWGAVIMTRGGLLAGSAAVVLLGSVLNSYFLTIPAQPFPLTIDRLLLAFLLIQYVVWRRLGATLRKPLGQADWAVLALLLVLAVSTLTHDWREPSSKPLSRYLVYYVMPAALYWVTRQAVQTERSTRALFAALAVFGVYLALTALAETHNLPGLVFPAYISSPQFPEFLGRGRGPFLNPAACGMFQGVCLAAGCMFWPRAGRLGRLGIAAFAGAMLTGIFCTYTRCAWMGGLASLLVVAGLQMPRRWRAPVLGAAIVGVSLVVALQWESVVSFKRDKFLSASATEDSTRLRPLLAEVAWKMFADRPLTGVGFGQYLMVNKEYSARRDSASPLAKVDPYVQHNVWLSLLSETGLPGLVAFVAMLGLWLRNAWKTQRNADAPVWARQLGLLFLAAFASYLPNAMFQDLSIVVMASMMLFFVAGLSEGIAYQCSRATAGAGRSVATAAEPKPCDEPQLAGAAAP